MRRRRKFISLISGVAAVCALSAHAQQPAVPVIGMLSGQSAEGYSHLVEAVRLGLKDEGFVDGQNVTIEYRWAAGRDEQLPAMAVELVNRPVAVLLTGGSPWSTISAKAATATIPIVFTTASDPVKLGYVASLNRPGGNVTGVSFLGSQLVEKRLELASQLVSRTFLSDLWGDHANRGMQQKLSRVPPPHSDEEYCFSILATKGNWNPRLP